MTGLDPRVPAPEPDQDLDDSPPPFTLDGRCEYCFAWLPADGLCRCATSLRELEQARVEIRRELSEEL